MKSKFIFKAASAATLIAALAACTPNISPDVINSDTANKATNTVQGTVVSMQTVEVKNSDNMVGTLGGAAIGGVAGSAIGGGRGSVLGAIGGALAGGFAGNAISNKVTQQQGVQYVIKTTSGHLMTVVQGSSTQQPIQVGQCVYVIQGAQSRVMPC